MHTKLKVFHLPYKQSNLELIRFGKGDDLLIMFHGFGDSAHLFKPFFEPLSERYTGYAISLPYHGATEWLPNFFDKEDLLKLIGQLLEKEGKERFTLMGYSLGGKISLSLIEPLASKLNRVILLGADGIKTHRLYDVTGLPPFVLALIKVLMRVPAVFFALARLMHRKGILSKFVYDFTVNHFSTKRQRRRFFCISRSVHFFVSDLESVQEALNKRNIPVLLFYGIRDEVILIDGGKEFHRNLKNSQLIELDRGHLMIDEGTAHILVNALKNDASQQKEMQPVE